MPYRASAISRQTPTGTNDFLLNLSYAAAEDSTPHSKVGVILVLDVSPSMEEGGTLQYVKDYLNDYLIQDDNMPEGIAFACVTFAADAETVFVYKSFSKKDKKDAADKMKSIVARSATNVHAGLERAQEIQLNFPTHDWHMILLTDGEANTGPFKQVDVYTMAFSARKSGLHPTLRKSLPQ